MKTRLSKRYNLKVQLKEGNLLIEVKPQRLSKSKGNLLKFEAAQKYCQQNNLQFLIFTENSTTITKEMAASDSHVKLLNGANK